MAQTRRQSRRRVRDDFDGAWKNMLSEQRFSSFVAFFMPDAHDQIDWKRPVTFLEQELRAITRRTKRGHRSVDRLVKVWLIDGAEKWLLIHIEIQSQEDADFPFRMFQYFFRALDLFEGRSIECLGILADPNPAWRPQSYEQTMWQTRVAYEFRMVKLLDYGGRLDELESSENPFARFVLAHLKTLETQGDFETRLQWKLRIIQGLYDIGVSEAEIGQLYHDFDWLLALPDALETRYHNTMTQFEEARTMPHLTTAERIGRKIGREEGREEGALQEAQSLLLRIGGKRLGVPSEKIKARVLGITDVHQVEMLCERVLDVETWLELFPQE